MEEPNRRGTIDIFSGAFPGQFLKKLNLDPITKYRKYSTPSRDMVDIFPWRLLIHLLLVIATSAQIMILTNQTISHSRGDVTYLHHWFIEEPVSQVASP